MGGRRFLLLLATPRRVLQNLSKRTPLTVVIRHLSVRIQARELTIAKPMIAQTSLLVGMKRLVTGILKATVVIRPPGVNSSLAVIIL